MSIAVDENLCIGCGACAAVCPQTFVMNDEGKSKVVAQSEIECAKNASTGCPVQAITVS
ncbi:MAG: ferredoxin [bacterium]